MTPDDSHRWKGAQNHEDHGRRSQRSHWNQGRRRARGRGTRRRRVIPLVRRGRPDREGLAGALAGADVLVDVTNSPSLDGGPAQEFFKKSTANLVDAAKRAGVGHYVALSIVGVDGLPESGYFQAKVAQERIITESAIPYSIVHATQFAEFADAIIESMTVGDEVRVRCADPADPRRGGCCRGRAHGSRRAAQRHRERRWAGEDHVRAAGPRIAGAEGRRHEGRRRRPGSPLLRGAADSEPGHTRLALRGLPRLRGGSARPYHCDRARDAARVPGASPNCSAGGS